MADKLIELGIGRKEEEEGMEQTLEQLVVECTDIEGISEKKSMWKVDIGFTAAVRRIRIWRMHECSM